MKKRDKSLPSCNWDREKLQVVLSCDSQGFDVAACADSASPFCAKKSQILLQGTHYFNEFGAFSFPRFGFISLVFVRTCAQNPGDAGNGETWILAGPFGVISAGIRGCEEELQRAGTANSRILQDSASLGEEGIGWYGQGGTAVVALTGCPTARKLQLRERKGGAVSLKTCSFCLSNSRVHLGNFQAKMLFFFSFPEERQGLR